MQLSEAGQKIRQAASEMLPCWQTVEDRAAEARRAAPYEKFGPPDALIAIDAIGGATRNAMAAAPSDGGTVASYGLFSGEACRAHPADLGSRGASLRGLWPRRAL